MYGRQQRTRLRYTLVKSELGRSQRWSEGVRSERAGAFRALGLLLQDAAFEGEDGQWYLLGEGIRWALK